MKKIRETLSSKLGSSSKDKDKEEDKDQDKRPVISAPILQSGRPHIRPPLDEVLDKEVIDAIDWAHTVCTAGTHSPMTCTRILQEVNKDAKWERYQLDAHDIKVVLVRRHGKQGDLPIG